MSSMSTVRATVVLTEFRDGVAHVHSYTSLKDLIEDQLIRKATWSWERGSWADQVHLEALRDLRYQLDEVYAKVVKEFNESNEP